MVSPLMVSSKSVKVSQNVVLELLQKALLALLRVNRLYKSKNPFTTLIFHVSFGSEFVCITVKTVHPCPNSEVSCPIFKYRTRRSGNSSQRLTPNLPIVQKNVRTNVANSIQDLFWGLSFSNKDFKTVEEGLAIVKFQLKCSWIDSSYSKTFSRALPSLDLPLSLFAS